MQDWPWWIPADIFEHYTEIPKPLHNRLYSSRLQGPHTENASQEVEQEALYRTASEFSILSAQKVLMSFL